MAHRRDPDQLIRFRVTLDFDTSSGEGVSELAAVASNSHGTVALGINVSISYMTAARGGTLVAEAEEVSINPKLATYLIRILDEEQTLIALFQGTVYRKREALGD